MKVYEVIYFSCLEFENYIETSLFLSEDKAKDFFNHRVEVEKEESAERINEEERIVVEKENYFDVYLDGEASVYEVEMRLIEHDVEE